MASIEIKSIEELLQMGNLRIPNYQRPYRWTNKNMSDLLEDIGNAIDDANRYKDFKYRIGTVILHKDTDKDTNKEVLNIVDGQQRIISLILLYSYVYSYVNPTKNPEFNCRLYDDELFSDKESQANIHNNAMFIRDWFSLKKDFCEDVCGAFSSVLEVVVITVDKIQEAFQLFDSQNTRGKTLDPHDLLKAYHLRAMRGQPYEMRHAVTKWEAIDTKKIRELFDLYLYPIRNWSRRIKTTPFTANQIDVYKGIHESAEYTYARRARKAMPYFQLTEPIIEGGDFFEMVAHYLEIEADIENEIKTNDSFEELKKIMESPGYRSTGFNYAKNLFRCALLCYYDRFHNFDAQAVKKLFIWAFMLRVDLEHLGFDSVNKYAIGEWNDNYTNRVPIFSVICNARVHTEISNLQIQIKDRDQKDERWKKLCDELRNLNGKREAGSNEQKQ